MENATTKTILESQDRPSGPHRLFLVQVEIESDILSRIRLCERERKDLKDRNRDETGSCE